MSPIFAFAQIQAPSIGPETNINITLAIFFAIGAAMVTAVWKLANVLRDIKEQIKALETHQQETWNFGNMKDFAYQLERKNVKIGLIVPNVQGHPGPRFRLRRRI